MNTDESENVYGMSSRNSAPHRERHPNDYISFGETPPEKEEVERKLPKPKPFMTKEKRALKKAINKGDETEALKFSTKKLKVVAQERFRAFQANSEIKPPMLPLDEAAEPIHYPKGGGEGKMGYVRWLIRYNAFYRDVMERARLEREIEQSIL